MKDIGKVARGALKPVHEREDGSPRPLEQGISILLGIAWRAPRVRVVCRCGNASVLLENDCGICLDYWLVFLAVGPAAWSSPAHLSHSSDI